MAQYTKATDASGTTRYKDGTKFVKGANVPANIKEALEGVPDGTIIDELGDVVDTSTDTDEGSDDEDLPTDPSKSEPNVPEDTSSVDDQGELDDGAGEDVETGLSDPESAKPAPKSTKNLKIGGMGFPAAKGKTLSVFSDVPHETVKNIGGIMVPLTIKEYAEKTDAEIIEKLKELGKI